MIIEDAGYWRKVAKVEAEHLNAILWFGFLSSITVCCLIFSGESTVSFLDVKFPINHSWIPLTLFTIFHIIFTFRFVNAVRKYWELTKPSEYIELYKDIFFRMKA